MERTVVLLFGLAGAAFLARAILGAPVGIVVLSYLSGTIGTFGALCMLRMRRDVGYCPDTLPGALIVSLFWFLLMPFAAVVETWFIAADWLDPYWTRACAWWDRAGNG